MKTQKVTTPPVLNAEIGAALHKKPKVRGAEIAGISGKAKPQIELNPPAVDADLGLFAHAELQIIGRVVGFDEGRKLYSVSTGLGDNQRTIKVQIGPRTNFEKVRNLSAPWEGAPNVLPIGTLMVADGVQTSRDTLGAVNVRVVGNDIETSDYWAQRIGTHVGSLVAENFSSGEIDQDKMLQYRTYRSKTGDDVGQKTDQDGPVLSRTLYGIMQDALVNGSRQSLEVAKEIVEYLMDNFRYQPQGRDLTLWNSVVRPDIEADGTVKLLKSLASSNPEDAGQIPLYEQVYMLAGLSNYFFATRSPAALEAITDTLRGFWSLFHDEKSDGFVSHLDPKTLKPITSGPNANQINWNSTGDFGPAVLRSLITALGYQSTGPDDPYNEARELALSLLTKTTEQIIEHFPDPNGRPVRERFDLEWNPNTQHPIWQENRAVMGHNAKIAWNLSSYGALFRRMAQGASPEESTRLLSLASRAEETAMTIGKMVIKDGVNPATGGIFDILERDPSVPVPLTWGSHTDWWQQEQLILMSASLLPTAKGADREMLLETLRRATSFYVANFSNHEEGVDFFRVGANGMPNTQGEYGAISGHSKGLYHSSELYTLLMRLNAAYVTNGRFEHTFALEADRQTDTISVLPDFFVPGTLKIASCRVNGQRLTVTDPENMVIRLPPKFEGNPATVEIIYQGTGAEQTQAAL